MNQTKDQTKPCKKIYQAPTLRVYGDLREITQTSNPLGMMTDSRSPYIADRTH
jgi:hypothetical protein